MRRAWRASDRRAWAEGRSGFTALFERLAISLLQEMWIPAVARTLSLSWDEIDGIMQRAINRGLALRAQRLVRNIGIDEKSVKKRHKYVTIVTDLDRSEGLWVGSGRKRETIDRFWTSLSSAQLRAIDGVAMDMWPAYIESTLAHLPGADAKIVFDKFHVVKHLTHPVDLERRRESRRNPGLKRTRFAWIRNPKNMTEKPSASLGPLGIRAWARNFFQWYSWAIRSRLPRIAAVANLIGRHFENILTYTLRQITNAVTESVNSKIQWMKYQARGFRNEERFMRSIMFHCGGLDFRQSHPNS